VILIEHTPEVVFVASNICVMERAARLCSLARAPSPNCLGDSVTLDRLIGSD